MSYVQDSLVPGEKIIVEAKLHWSLFTGILITLVISFLLFSLDSCLGGLALGFALFQTVHSIILYRQTEFALTNKRIIAKTGGLIRRQSLELLLTKVESIDIKQGIRARIFRYGDIIVVGSGGTEKKIPFIANAMELRKQINNQIAQM